MNSKEYKQSLNKKVKDMTPEERKKYGMLRTRESRAKKKETHTMPDGKEMAGPKHISVGKNGKNKGNLPNKKLKCFILKAKNGASYKTCTTPEKDKAPKKTVRDKPRKVRKIPIIKAYDTVEDRKEAQKVRTKAKKAMK